MSCRGRPDPASTSSDASSHIRFGRVQGWTEDELDESLLHLFGYIGAPLVREAMVAASEVFAEMRAEEESTTAKGNE